MAALDPIQEKVVYSVTHTYIKVKNGSNKEEYIYGTLLMLEKPDGCHIEWREDPTHVDAANDSWDFINADAVSFTYSNSAAELTDLTPTAARTEGSCRMINQQKFHNPINFHVDNLRSFKRMKGKLVKNSCIMFILDCGTSHPPIYFPKGGVTDKFLHHLGKKVIITQSATDGNRFLVSPHQQEALESSFDALNLFADQGSALSRFAADPVRGTFTAFAKVSKLLTNTLVASEDKNSVPPEICDQLRISVEENETDFSAIHSTQPEDPDFLFIDEKAQLPEVEKKPRGEPLKRAVWEKFFDAEGRVTNPEELKQIIYRGGVSHDLRSEVWKFLLSFYSWDSTTREREEFRKTKVDEYFAMKLQWKSMTESQKSRFSDFRDRESLIEKDVSRTDRMTPFFSGDNNERLHQLNDILMTFVMYDFNLGYVQGMSDLLSPLLLVMENEVDTFWCFVGFMNLLHSNFEMDQEGMKLQLNQLNQIVQVADGQLYSYLDDHESSNMYFAFRWLLIVFKREFFMDDIMSLWEVFWTGLPCKNYQLVIATALLCQCKGDIIENQFGFNEILKYINDRSGDIVLSELLIQSEALAEQLITCTNLPSYVRKIISPGSQSSATQPSPDRKPARPTSSPRKRTAES